MQEGAMTSSHILSTSQLTHSDAMSYITHRMFNTEWLQLL